MFQYMYRNILHHNISNRYFLLIEKNKIKKIELLSVDIDGTMCY